MNWQAIVRTVRRLALRDGGQDLIEYGMLAALIAVVAMVGVNGLGTVIRTRFWDVVGNLL